MKIRIESASQNKEYFQIIKKYSINNNYVIGIDKEYESPYIIIEVDSLDFLPQMEYELDQLGDVQGLIFSTLDNNMYRILIYDCYIE